MPGRGRTPQHLDQAVVAASAAEGVLGGVDGARGELERGAGVVVEAADQAVVDGVGHVERIEAGPHAGEVGRAGLAEVVDETRRVLGGALALGRLAVEDAQRVLLEAGLVRRRRARSARSARNWRSSSR